jgi:hypothetical protein
MLVAVAGCTQSQVANEAEPSAAFVVESVEQINRRYGPTALANCTEVQTAALQYYAECQDMHSGITVSVERDILCRDLLPQYLVTYRECAETGGIVVSAETTPREPVRDFSLYADSVGGNGANSDEGLSRSSLSSVGGIGTATQTSVNNTVSVSSGTTHPGLPTRE